MPDLASFSEAVQMSASYHPSLGDLRNGKLVVNSMGLPTPDSGNFAVVYQTEYSGKRHALRCFIRPAADQGERFAHISAYLKRYPCRYFVDFEFHPQGLRVGGQWQPLMVMEWCDGVPLERHIKSLLGDADRLLKLAGKWVEMFDYLHNLDLAHGDIHPDNVIVHNDKLYLIDYDAVYIPALKGKSIQEAGQRNFQHPERNSSHYGPYMDNFPSWIVYYTLVLLSIDPDLWNRYQGGDQKLIFTADDYREPDKSQILNELVQSKNPIFQLVAHNIRDMLKRKLEDVATLNENLVRAAALPLPPQAPSDWWKDHQPTSRVTGMPSWLKKR